MQESELKHYLSDKYQGWESFRDNVVLPIFGKEDYEDNYETELLDNMPERRHLADATGIKSVKQCASVYVNGEPLYIFDITVADRIMMKRNRVGVQTLIRSVMEHYSGAFMIFHYEEENCWQWRFSFSYKGTTDEESTDRKRYTFLLGQGQSCRTAAQNFCNLYKERIGNRLQFSNIIDAFSVEALSDEFFDGYKAIYADIIFYITGKRMVKKGNKWEEVKEGRACRKILDEFSDFADPEKAVRDYVKKLMGRLVFLQFLQKKGWLGVPLNEDWGNGDHEFIQNLFANTKDKDNFVDGVLEAIFNDLNTEREGDKSKKYKFKIPYLNGGLFERDATDETRFPLPAKYMEDMLEFFSRYNFTIDENDPNDAEVGVDPEMLGRIFENLLEDNKDKGAFYTPKEIVQYMCRESLIAYLQTDQNEEYKESIRQFVTTHNAEILGRIKEDIDKKLQDVKICDPAIGSGAFPMGLLKELYQCRSAIESIHEDNASEIKKHIIQNNIYGVDIEKGAVDIARLRFWLSLIVDEKTPHALPNLDFKIMQGNSLLEQYKGVDLSNVVEKKREGTLDMYDDIVDVLRLDLRNLLAKYYDCTDHKEKKKLRKEMTDNVKQQLSEQGITINFGDLDLAGNDQFFLWHTWFYDVFSQGGFDIVIGNPPYVSSKDLSKLDKQIYKFLYDTAEKQFDLYSMFIEKGINFAKRQGIVSYIVPDSIIARSNFSAIRKKLVIDNTIEKWVHLNNVFETAVVSSLIFVCRKNKEKSYEFKYIKANTVKEWMKNSYSVVTINSEFVNSDIDKKVYFATTERIRLQNKLFETEHFGEKCILWRGEEIGKTSSLISDYQYTKSLPLITGKETRRYIIPYCTKWIKASDVVKSLNNYQEPKLLIRQIGTCINATIDKHGGITTQSVYALYPKEKNDRLHLNALLGILNSKLFDFFYKLLSGDKQIFTRIILENIKALPYPNMNSPFISKIEKNVERILSGDVNNISFENVIDHLVYHLYGLTYDEVLIVDPETPITREEYEKEQ